MPEPFSHGLRVRYAECDPQGVVFNAHYLAYFDIVLTELWREAFGGYATMLERGVDLVVAEAGVRYRRPARFDEELVLGLEFTKLGHTSITSRHTIGRAQELLAEGSMRHVVVDRTTLRKVPIPSWLRVGLAPWVVPDGSPEAYSSSGSSSPGQIPVR
ncbi:MAG: acyl-CoA thioesterase [Actinomycetota bacterium]|nr:acyl-CoA thioesterase [Actinomycetota bacterium]